MSDRVGDFYGKKEDKNEYDLFEATWWPVLKYANNHPKGFLFGIENYDYGEDIPDLTVEYKEHISKVINDDMACLIFKSGERMFFRWAVETNDGRFWFSSKNLCLLPNGKVLKFD